MTEYQEKLTRYARGLYQEKYKREAPLEAVGSIDADKGNGGCPTCGYDDGSGIFVYCGGVEVAEFGFFQLDEILAGIIAA